MHLENNHIMVGTSLTIADSDNMHLATIKMPRGIHLILETLVRVNLKQGRLHQSRAWLLRRVHGPEINDNANIKRVK